MTGIFRAAHKPKSAAAKANTSSKLSAQRRPSVWATAASDSRGRRQELLPPPLAAAATEAHYVIGIRDERRRECAVRHLARLRMTLMRVKNSPPNIAPIKTYATKPL